MMRTFLPSAIAYMLLLSSSSDAIDLPTFIGATHWNPCYYNTELPSLLDGAASLSEIGTHVIKLAFSNPTDNYPWNSPGWNSTVNFTSMTDLAKHPYYHAVFSNSIPGYPTNYSTFILVAYTWSQEPDWCHGIITPDDEAAITQEFSDFTLYLLTTFAQSQNRYIMQNWESDWAARCATYDPSVPPTPAAIQAMIKWLTARQAGVDQGRSQYCKLHLLNTPEYGGDCSAEDGKDILKLAGVEVYHAAEVNLVASAMSQPSNPPDGNIIVTVIPHVKLDMVSYSSYDTMKQSPLFGQALDFIASHHLPTPSSPSPAVYVGEYGIAQLQEPLSSLQSLLENVIGTAATISPVTQVRRAAHVMFWELFDNECPTCPNKRCSPKTGPVFNMSDLSGFWLIRPDGTKSWAWGYMQGIINGSIPIPTVPN